jgi:hypothetical protein
MIRRIWLWLQRLWGRLTGRHDRYFRLQPSPLRLSEMMVYLNGLLLLPGEPDGDYTIENDNLTFNFRVRDNDIIQMVAGPARHVIRAGSTEIAHIEGGSIVHIGEAPTPEPQNECPWVEPEEPEPGRTAWERILNDE